MMRRINVRIDEQANHVMIAAIDGEFTKQERELFWAAGFLRITGFREVFHAEGTQARRALAEAFRENVLWPRGTKPEAGVQQEWQCICGMDELGGGFDSCTAEGRIIEPLKGVWDGIHYICLGCGRIIDQRNGDVVGMNVVALEEEAEK